MTLQLLSLWEDAAQLLRDGFAPEALIYLLLTAMVLAGLGGVFAKAGKPAWACLVPIYAELTLLEIAGATRGWLILLLLPVVAELLILLAPYDDPDSVLLIITTLNLTGGITQLVLFVYLVQRFGKGSGYFLGVLFFPFLFLPMLAWGDAKYSPPFKRRRRLPREPLTD